MRLVRLPARGVERVSVRPAVCAPSVEVLARAHEEGRAGVLEAVAYIRRHRPEADRAAALDRWLRGALSSAYAWQPGITAAAIQGLADGLAEVGQP